MWQTEKFTIRIDELDDGHYRYASWAKGKTLADKPDLVLKNGTVRVEGTGAITPISSRAAPIATSALSPYWVSEACHRVSWWSIKMTSR